MATTIQISETLQKELGKRKLSNHETYEEVIVALIEDAREITDETKRQIEQSRAESKAGKRHPLRSVKRELGL